jgi:hypothetical protein
MTESQKPQPKAPTPPKPAPVRPRPDSLGKVGKSADPGGHETRKG